MAPKKHHQKLSLLSSYLVHECPHTNVHTHEHMHIHTKKENIGQRELNQ